MNAFELLKNQCDNSPSSSEDWEEVRKVVSSDPKVMDGLPVFHGTRVPVYIVLDYLSEGYQVSDILRDYPDLDEKKIRVAIKFAELLTTLH